MAIRTETVQFYSCDLCEEDFDEGDLVRLYGPQNAGRRAQVDVCPDCQQRPIAELVAWIQSRQRANAAGTAAEHPRPLDIAACG